MKERKLKQVPATFKKLNPPFTPAASYLCATVIGGGALLPMSSGLPRRLGGEPGLKKRDDDAGGTGVVGMNWQTEGSVDDCACDSRAKLLVKLICGAL
jgi:hypothetical protein